MPKVNRESLETTRETPKRTFTIEHRRNLSKAMMGHKPWNLGLTKADPRVRRGIEKTWSNPNIRANLSKALMGHPGTFRRKHTEEEKEKIRRAHLGRPKHYRVWNEGLTAKTDERLRRIGRKISKTLLARPEEVKRKAALHAKKFASYTKVSKFEQQVVDEFIRQGIEIMPQHCLKFDSTMTYVDVYIPEHRLCVYIDGSYWHRRPEVVARDERIAVVLKANGYQVLRFWDDQHTPSSIVDEVRKMI